MRNKKYYAIDVALMDKRANAFADENLGWRLETLVYLELRRRFTGVDMDMYYYQQKAAEADFMVCDGNRTVAVYQVRFPSDKTKNREMRGSVAAAKATKYDRLFLITDHERDDIKVDGYKIAIRPAYV